MFSKNKCEHFFKFSKAIDSGEFNLKNWKVNNRLNPQEMNEEAANWIFVVDSLNFSFWSDSSVAFTVNYQEKDYTGYWSLCAAIDRALMEGIQVTSPSYLENITLEQVEYIFRSLFFLLFERLMV